MTGYPLEGLASNRNTVFKYETGKAFCPVCKAQLQPGWHFHRSKTFGLLRRTWWYRPTYVGLHVRAWKIGRLLWYHYWTHPKPLI